MSIYLDKIASGDIAVNNLGSTELEVLAMELRKFLVKSISKTGGHLSSNLGVVELTIALHYVFDVEVDRLIWDVGHQSYIHKILTGRMNEFSTLRQFGGLSGFPDIDESQTDAFNTGHSSTSLSVGLGMVKARELLGDKYSVISIIGDGAITGGMAFEALNNAARLKSNYIIILNDNQMSIDENVGALSTYLNSIRTATKYNDIKENIESYLNSIPVVGTKVANTVRKSKNSIKQLFIQGMLFENLGIKYIGPINGHNIDELIKNINYAKRVEGPVVLHIKTIKGKGYSFAQKNPGKFHGAEPFNIKTGKFIYQHKVMTYTDVFAKKLVELGETDERIVAVCAAMPYGTGIVRFANRFPNRSFDVGIAEQHAVAFAAGLASKGLRPVVGIYSTFLQRAYDQILHDVCIKSLPVVLVLDRAGIVGADGKTHQGIFDLSYLMHIPNLTIMCPSNDKELESMLEYAINLGKPVVIRYPKGEAIQGDSAIESVAIEQSEIISKGTEAAIIATGSMVAQALEAAKKLQAEGISMAVVNMRIIKPLDTAMLDKLAKEYSKLITIEENVLTGAFGQQVLSYVNTNNTKTEVLNIALKDCFIEHGTREELLNVSGLDCESIVNSILEFIRK